MNKREAKQIAQWLAALPADQVIYGQDWNGQQSAAVFAKVAANRAAYDELFQALDAADSWLAGLAQDCANENIDPCWNDNQLGFWSKMYSALAGAAGDIWEGAGRNVNAEIGRIIY